MKRRTFASQILILFVFLDIILQTYKIINKIYILRLFINELFKI